MSFFRTSRGTYQQWRESPFVPPLALSLIHIYAVVLMSKEKLSYAQQVCVKSAGKAMQRTGMVGPGAKVGVCLLYTSRCV